MTATFPAISSVLSPQPLVEGVLPGFGVGTVKECQFYSGGFNHTCLVKIEAVSGRLFFVDKRS
jgi:hypothetical protein